MARSPEVAKAELVVHGENAGCTDLLLRILILIASQNERYRQRFPKCRISDVNLGVFQNIRSIAVAVDT